MSDQPRGPQWWLASDGKWYAPELHPDSGHDAVTEPVPTTPPPPPSAPQGTPPPYSPGGASYPWLSDLTAPHPPAIPPRVSATTTPPAAPPPPAPPFPTGAPGPVPPPKRSNAAIWALIVLALLVGAVVGVFVPLAGRRSESAPPETVTTSAPSRELSPTTTEELGPTSTLPEYSPEPPETLPTTTTTTIVAAPPSTTVASKTMPDVVCMDLQTAQDTIQRAGVFFSRSFDASGQGRLQIIDRNWIVVSQEPNPGVHLGEFQARLGVVKTDEPNPC